MLDPLQYGLETAYKLPLKHIMENVNDYTVICSLPLVTTFRAVFILSLMASTRIDFFPRFDFLFKARLKGRIIPKPIRK